MKYLGSCHCGKIKFEVEGDIKEVMDCNCSMCSRRGCLLWFVPKKDFRLRTPESHLGTYTFNKHIIKHHFCKVCGIAPFSESSDGKGNEMAAVNVRCLEDFDFSKVPVKHFNGKDY